MRKLYTVIFIILLISSLTISLTAQDQSVEIESSLLENNGKDESVVELTADQVNYDKENDLMVFIGNVIIIQDDTTLTAELASFDVNTKNGNISENVKLIKEDITITGDKLEAFLNDKRYIFENQVELVQKREDNKGESDNITWLCQKLEIFTDTKNMNASGEVVINKKDYTITAQEAIYNNEEDKITFTNGVKIEEIENNRKISGDRAIYFIGDDRLEVTGNVKSSMILD